MKRRVLIMSAAALMAAGVSAQQLRPGYITAPASNQLHKYVSDWTPGQEMSKTYSDAGEESAWEDEEFFTSRVKLKPQFVNVNTQVDKTKPESANKRLLFWVPINENTGNYGEWRNALPNGVFDSEVFSLWSYVTHYGNWTSPYGWVPGAFADAAHRNGVLVSGVASIPWASSSGPWHTCLGAMANNFSSDAGAEKLSKFMMYHGVDGLGYNSEFNGGSFMSGLRTMHEKVVKNITSAGLPACENPWYSGTSDGGSIGFDVGLRNQQANFGDGEHPRTIQFLNYNWGYSSYFSNNLDPYFEDGAACAGRDKRDVYMGQNMQSGCASSSEWQLHLTQPYSIGLWGAHSVNYIWINRSAGGSDDKTRQSTYQKHLEWFFTNGKRNPAISMEVPTNRAIAASESWHGMSRYMEARSSLSWDLSAEPFITFFNLGNGQYYNWKGERMHNNSWYNLGVQDYMPTWRFWFATELLGREVPEGIDASFTWDDAYMGGSCLRLTATNTDAAYMHLFKTNFNVKAGDVVTVRYKVLSGTADLDFVLTKNGSETKEIQGNYGKIFDKEGNTYGENGKTNGVIDYDADWQVKTFKFGSRGAVSPGDIALMGLKVANANNLNVMFGEVSIVRGSAPTPAVPGVRRGKVLNNNYRGIDGKIYYSMPNNKEAGEPVYNLDVNTSLFRLWSKTDVDGVAKCLGTTTSWAGILFSAPALNATKVQFGVSAVSLDFKSESEIAWTAELPVGDYKAVDDLKVSKNPITTNEEFTVSFLDPAHAAVDWELSNDGGTVLASATNATELHVDGISQTGAYNLKVGETTYPGYIAITDPSSGRQPIIETLTVNGDVKDSSEEVSIEPNKKLTLGYTGREADGTGSRGISLEEMSVGVSNAQLGIGTYQSFSVAFWLKVNTYPQGEPASLMLIENRSGSWPKNNWGFFWARTVEGSFKNYKVDGGWGKGLDSSPNGMRLYADYDGNMGTGKWNHLVYVFEYNSQNQIRTRFYVNGILQNISCWQWANKDTRESTMGGDHWDDGSLTTGIANTWGKNETNTGYATDNFPLSTADWISVGGLGPNGMAALKGVVDDFQVWGKAMEQEDVNLSMNGLGGLETLPADVIAFWDFEDEPTSDYGFVSRGQKQIKAYRFKYGEGDKEGQGVPTPIVPEYSAGSPYVPGTAFDVVTTPTWTARKGILENAKGTATEGSVDLSYIASRAGSDYTVSLMLANPLGNHTMEYPVFRVLSGIDGVEAEGVEGNVEAYTVGDGLFVEFAEDGNYTVEVYNVSGMLMAKKSLAMTAGQNMSIRLGAQGVYVVRVLRDNQLARTIKVIRK